MSVRRARKAVAAAAEPAAKAALIPNTVCDHEVVASYLERERGERGGERERERARQRRQ
jgi:hypothetical protein